MQTKELYEETYKEKKHFSFGKNWQDFLKSLNEERINNAKKSLVNFLGGEEKIKGKTFVDIGCGSGLFSLVAYLLGASRVISVDIDDFSIACAGYLKEKENNPGNWNVFKGSALDKEFIQSLGQFDIVYSWGVLHHTGNMWKAFENVSFLIKSEGIFYLAIYNNNRGKNALLIGSSNFWLKIKKMYNGSSNFEKKLIEIIYYIYFIIGHFIVLRNPFKYIRNYGERGMSFHHDVVDWLGGYPYEFVSPDKIINYFGKENILCKKLIFQNGLGCNEYLFIKNDKFN